MTMPPPRSRPQIPHPLLLVLLPLLAAGVLAAIGIHGALDAAEHAAPALSRMHLTLIEAGMLPRIAVALLAGALLGLAGTVFQQVLRNPVAEPATLGVSAGAHLALAIAVIAAPGLGPSSAEITALAGAAIAITLTLLIGRAAGAAGSGRIILAGLIITLTCGAATAFITVFNHDYLTAVQIWGAGSLVQDGWGTARTLLWRLVPAALLAAVLLRPLALLDLGETAAGGLGLNTRWLRLGALGLAVAASATVTAAVGVIGFIGLAAPALARLAGAHSLRSRLMVAPLAGAALLWLADELTLATGRLIGGAMLPTGALTAVLGAPLLMVMLARRGWLPPAPPSLIGSAAPVTARRHRRVAVLLMLALVVAVAGGLLVGRGPDGLHLAWGMAELDALLPWRWPRLLAACAAGAMLGVAGTVLQRLSGNPLASPEVLGLTSGVILATIATALFLPDGGSPAMRLLAGSTGAALALLLVMAVGARSGFAPDRLLLAGVAVGTAGTAFVSVMTASGDPRMGWLLAWMAGSTWGITPAQALAALAGAVFLPALALGVMRPLDILPLGPVVAAGLGIRVSAMRALVLVLACIATAAATTLVGPLSFVGVIAPHLARLAGFGRARGQILAAALGGAAIMAGADWLGRVLLAPYQVPAGLMATLIGGPWLMRLLRRG